MLIRGREDSLYSKTFMRIDLHQDDWDAPQYAATVDVYLRRREQGDGCKG